MAPDADRHLTFIVEEDSAGDRLDVAVASLSLAPRAQVRRWIEGGHITVDDRPSKASHRVRVGEAVAVAPPEPVAMSTAPQDIALEILHEDDQLVVVDKPAGMVVHPGPGHPDGTLVNALLHHCGDLAGIGGVLRPGIVHRLDRGTSGVMVAAKTDRAHSHLARQFHDHTIERRYRAFVRVAPSAEAGSIDRPIGRHPRDRKRMSVRTESARSARTDWTLRERYVGAACLDVRPHTGRTHQIRVHLAWAGLPIIGDPVYGKLRGRRDESVLDRPALHAEVLGFVHPTSEVSLRFEAPLPEDLQRLERKLRGGSAS